MLRFSGDAERTLGQHRLPMSSMIDVVFLLLVFFVMTFKITSQEADFAMGGVENKGPGPISGEITLPVTLRLTADQDGLLKAIQLNETLCTNFNELQLKLIELKAARALEDVTMTINADASLKYQHVIDALDHVTAYRDSTGSERPLVTATRFANRP